MSTFGEFSTKRVKQIINNCSVYVKHVTHVPLFNASPCRTVQEFWPEAKPVYSWLECRGGSRTSQGRASNPSERGTRGRASKALRGWDLKIFVSVISKWWVLCHPGDIYWQSSFQKRAPWSKGRVSGHPGNPQDPPLECLLIDCPTGSVVMLCWAGRRRVVNDGQLCVAHQRLVVSHLVSWTTRVLTQFTHTHLTRYCGSMV